MSASNEKGSGPQAGPERQFREQLALGRFMLQRARRSGRCFFYPRVAEPGTGDADLEWVEASGAGTVYSTTVVRRAPDKGGDFNIALVDLAEGPRLLSRVLDIAPDAVRIGMPVSARIDVIDGEHAVVFVPRGGAA
ncbi:MAG: Zn-ribbon domain-containing OB-fold protein [Alphaproteobacteria bacterium]